MPYRRDRKVDFCAAFSIEIANIGAIERQIVGHGAIACPYALMPEMHACVGYRLSAFGSGFVWLSIFGEISGQSQRVEIGQFGFGIYREYAAFTG